MTYRSDVDGLRAIAMLVILIYHAGLSLFPSGFIALDIFFVISGFLITNILQQSLQKGEFSFIKFFNSRLWRLQPAFICMLLGSTLLTLLFFLPDDLLQYGRSARKSSLFLANVYFKTTTTGYFSPEINQLPLLHTWSLSVEWQFYFILPLALYLLHRLFGHRYITHSLYFLTAFFFVASLYLSHQYPSETYFMFPSRIFEFLIGSCVAVSQLKPFKIKKIIVNGIGISSVLGLYYLASSKNIQWGYPNWYTLIPCLLTAMFLIMGKYCPNNIITQLLSTRPLVFIGILSYSLYLWHWVIFALIHYLGIEETAKFLLVAFIAIFVLAYCSWRFIEQPLRQFKRIKFTYSVMLLLVLPTLLIHANVHLAKKYQGFPQRFNAELVRIYQLLQQYSSEKRPLCIGRNNYPEANCHLGSKQKNSKTAIMIGDSFSNHLWGLIDNLAQAGNINVLAQATSSCLTLPGIYLFDWWHFKNNIYKECHEQTARYFTKIEKDHYDYVILGQSWANYLGNHVINQEGDVRSPLHTQKRIEAALNKALLIITQTGAKPVIVKSTALMQQNFHDCFFKHIKIRHPYQPEKCNFNLLANVNDEWFNSLFQKMSAKYPQLIIIDPKKVQCPEGRCSVDIDGVPVYRDVGHITDYASYQFGKQYLRQFGNPLA